MPTRRKQSVRRTCDQLVQLHDLANQYTREAGTLLYKYAQAVENIEERTVIVRCAARMEMLAELAAELS